MQNNRQNYTSVYIFKFLVIFFLPKAHKLRCAISGFRSGTDDTCVLLWPYAALRW